jgi:dTDP-4-amino-4,6-dideoxygalactose transaminase
VKPIPFINPIFPDPKELSVDFAEIYKNNYYTNNGPFYYKFKSAAEAYIGQGVSVSVMANATLSLMLALKSLMISNRPYVLVPSFTFAAGPQAIVWAGFEPLFIDIDRIDCQPEVNQISEYLVKNNNKVAGILMCNTFGIGAQAIEEWEELAHRYNLPMVIDSASGFGSDYVDGSKLGARGDCEIFSLHATKPFGIGEGAIVSSRNTHFITEMEMAKNFGFNENKESSIPALNAKITEFSCAIGLRLLPGLDESIAKRRDNLRLYKQFLSSHLVEFVAFDENAAVQFASILLPNKPHLKQTVLASLKKQHIQARDYYCPAVHKHSFFNNYPCLELTDTEYVADRIISLPVSPALTEKDIERVCGAIVQCL